MKKGTMLTNTDYRSLFTLGIIFTGAGVAMGLAPVMGLGLVFLFVGLLNRNKWSPKENEEI